jgi:hypothetical protein
MAQTSARVDMEITNNVTWNDAIIFGVAGDTSWNFSGQNFRLDVKGNKDQPAALLTISTGLATIVVDDINQRILHFNVQDTVIAAALVPGDYVYDLVMYDFSAPPIRVQLMSGKLKVIQGITGN